MRDRTSVAQLDSAEAEQHAYAETRQQRARRRRQPTAFWRNRQAEDKPPLTLGNIIHFVIAVFFLWPVFLVIAAIWSLGDAVNFIRHTIEALISSTFWIGRLCREWTGNLYLHKNSPDMLRLRGQRRAFGHEASKDWIEAGKALVGIGRAWSKTFGLGGLFSSLERRIEHANVDWRRYVVTKAYDNSEAPVEFPEDYIVVDELPRGGSSARLYVVRKASEGENSSLYVLKYFNLRAGGNLESVIRESQAAQLAQKLGLIIESKLGEQAFWYVMPYYRGETLTGGVIRNIKQARENMALPGHYRISLGYVHQLLQIIAQYHEAGVFHKDIKPDNLIINGERIYLVDIGLMTPLGSMSQLTTHGTEYFRDPEMVKLALEGREVRQVDAAKFDVYSIGAVMFFALSGEFPTSGALSRLPREVPMATQWVVNRAMTGMQQRYSDARAMLTDIDYLCWAAAQGTLEQVKPADLPSFRGMPVPTHLQQHSIENSGNTPERLAAAPGGYGAWYSAPAYAAPGRRSGWKSALTALVIVGGVLFLTLFAFGIGTQVTGNNPPAGVESKDQLSARLPDDASKFKPVYEDIDSALARNVQSRTNPPVNGVSRLELAPSLVRGVDEVTADWEKAILSDLRRHKINNPGVLFGEREILFLSIDSDPEDQKLASGIELELQLEAARQNLKVPAYSTEELRQLRSAVASISDTLALHREIAARYADAGRVPAFIVTFTIEHATGDEVHIRGIYPGREYRAVVPFGEKIQQPPAEERPAIEPGTTRRD